jgi:hypothetical protein
LYGRWNRGYRLLYVLLLEVLLVAYTQLDIAREALAQIGTRTTISSLGDGSPEADYINLLYIPIRDFLLVEGDYDFAAATRPAVRLAAPEPPPPWVYGYEYPGDGLRIRQLLPLGWDALDPRPIEWNIAHGFPERYIFTNQQVTSIIFTVPAEEARWDAIFRQSFVRMLASALAFALENRIEASKVKMEEALGFAGMGNMRDK